MVAVKTLFILCIICFRFFKSINFNLIIHFFKIKLYFYYCYCWKNSEFYYLYKEIFHINHYISFRSNLQIIFHIQTQYYFNYHYYSKLFLIIKIIVNLCFLIIIFIIIKNFFNFY